MWLWRWFRAQPVTDGEDERVGGGQEVNFDKSNIVISTTTTTVITTVTTVTAAIIVEVQGELIPRNDEWWYK